MQHRRARARVLATALSLGALLAAAPAYADTGGPCTIGSAVSCPLPTLCSDDADCFGRGLGRCVSNGSGAGGICSPDCNSVFACNSDSDCPLFPALTGTCRPTSISGVPGLCEYHDATDRPFVTFCTSGGTASLAQVRPCIGAGGSWANGDCDGDGLLNQFDMNPCSSSVMVAVPGPPSPFCLGGQVCEGVSSSCLPFLHCLSDAECAASAARISSRAGWSCAGVPGASASTFCQPTCDATVHCVTSADCRTLGTCRFVSGALSMCLVTSLASCASTCSSNPLDWASAQGDCDGDGAQNGCDGTPCSPTGPMCVFNHVCSIDAGIADAGMTIASDGGGVITVEAGVSDASLVDAGGANVDASVPDAASPDDAAGQDDAASTSDAATSAGDGSTAMDASSTPIDAGHTAMDAGTGPTVTPGLGFGGGGGCRCAVVGGESRNGSGAAFVAFVLVGLVAKRRSRPESSAKRTRPNCVGPAGRALRSRR